LANTGSHACSGRPHARFFISRISKDHPADRIGAFLARPQTTQRIEAAVFKVDDALAAAPPRHPLPRLTLVCYAEREKFRR
jgi:hypothetical protein